MQGRCLMSFIGASQRSSLTDTSEVERVTTNVLVVDDEEIICTLFAAMLSQYGSYHVVTTTDGRQVMDILRREPFHVVLLDMSMPAISGLDLLRQITRPLKRYP